MTQTVLITGASGFVGQAVCEAFCARGFHVRALVRDPNRLGAYMRKLDSLETETVRDLCREPPARATFEGVHAVVHLAGSVLDKKTQNSESGSFHQEVNVRATRRLAQAAATNGVRRFVYLSSIKASGAHSTTTPLTEADEVPVPNDAYGQSKREAEDALFEVCDTHHGMHPVVVRTPVVYGPRVKGNILTLLRAIDRKLPLPFGSATHNRRSLVGVQNLADFLMCCTHSPAAQQQRFLVSDGRPVSTAELLQTMAASMHKKACLVPVPERLFRAVARAAGKEGIAERIFGSLELDTKKAAQMLQWEPKHSMREELDRTAAWFQNRGSE